ncbi:MAG: nucleoside deaminase [Rhodocyclaceae bacterium]
MKNDEYFLREAIRLARDNSAHGGRPFGAVVVKGDEIIATGVNQILSTCDPTSHAELNAIRSASQKIGSPNLAGCRVYASGHPCPMCLAAMRMAGVSDIAYAYSNEDGAPYGLSTAAIYAELAKPLAEQSIKMRHVPTRPEDGADLYADWKQRQTPPA